MCFSKLHLEFSGLLDSMYGAAEKAYSAWRREAFLVDKRGRVVFGTGSGERNLSPEELDTALRKLSTPLNEPNGPRRFQ